MAASNARRVRRMSEQQAAIGRNYGRAKYYNNMALSMYTSQRKYENMGNYFNVQMLESCLYFRGWATIWYDPIVESFLVANVCPDSEISMAGDYTRWHAVTAQGDVSLDTGNAVIIYDNPARYIGGSFSPTPIPPAEQISPIIDQLVLLDRSIDVNVNSLAVPIIMQGPEELRLSINQQMRAIDDGARYVYLVGDTSQTPGMRIEALRTEATNNIASFSSERDKKWSELLSTLGIQNVGISKAERLITAEADANNEQINLIAHGKLQSRRDALNRLNAIYGTECKVSNVNARMDTGEIRPDYTSSNNGASSNDDADVESEVDDNG